jgi:hypothetical protein
VALLIYPAGNGQIAVRLGECRQFHHILLRYRLEWLARLAPRCQPTFDHEGVEPSLAQFKRHPGARRFARSSAIQINVLISWQVLDFLDELIRLEADRSPDALCTGVIVAVAANIHDEDSALLCFQALR